jgi:hypothetical protein
MWEEMTIKMAPLQIPGDPAAGDDPIKGILYLDPLVWDTVITDNTSNNNIRTFETNAMKRASYDNLSKHPLFSGSPILWNGVLIRKMQFGIRFNASDAYKYVAVADKLWATETAGTVAAGLSTTHQMCALDLPGRAGAGPCLGREPGQRGDLLDAGEPHELRAQPGAGRRDHGRRRKAALVLPNSNGDLEPTDFGVLVIDSVVKKRNV